MRSDAHLFVSLYPLRAGESVAAICGAPILHSAIEFHWDGVPVNARLEISRGVCSKCLKALKPNKQREFIYAVRSR